MDQSQIMRGGDEVRYRFLSGRDESEPYQIDVTEVWIDVIGSTDNGIHKPFVLAEASGCSCWEGEYDKTEFDTLEDLERHLIEQDSRWARPSIEECRAMVGEARATLLYEQFLAAAVARA